jgi:hypothetical protein
LLVVISLPVPLSAFQSQKRSDRVDLIFIMGRVFVE